MHVPSPRTLLLASLVLFAAFAIGILLSRSPSPPAPPTTTAVAPPPPPPPPLQVTPSAFAAVVRARAGDVVAWGPAGMRPLLWRPLVHGRARLEGLLPNTRYVATAGGDSVAFTTPPIPSTVTATARDGVLRADGAPFFPLIAWEECPNRWRPDLADGIDLFGGNPCTNLASLLTGVAGRALVAGTTEDVQGTTGPGLVGWFYPDEADARGLTGASLAPTGAGLRFLTLTSHFFSGAAPLPEGRGMYPGLLARADVVGFDLYPLQELCRPELLPWVFDAQAALRRLAPGKPTFQWIEEREMRCPQAADAVTPATIRVESWLAIAGGATGLGFFPEPWSAATGNVIRGIAAHVRQLLPALVQPPLPVSVSPAAPSVRASARADGGALYLLVVNAGTARATVTLRAPQLGGRTFVSDERARGGALELTLPPLTARVLVSPPAGA